MVAIVAFGSRASATATPNPMAAAVSRFIGSTRRLSAGSSGRSCRMRCACDAPVTTRMREAGSPLRSRFHVERSSVSEPRMGWSCFGTLLREMGQRRVPLPPARRMAYISAEDEEPEGEAGEDAVDAEGDEVVGTDVREQPFHAGVGDGERDGAAEREQSEFSRAEGEPGFQEVEPRRGGHGRDREQEGELDDGGARPAEPHAAEDGGGRTRDAGDHRDGLREADEDGVPVGNRGEVLLRGVRRLEELLEGDERDAAQDERPDDDRSVPEQVRLHDLVEEEAEDRGRDERRGHAQEDLPVEQEALPGDGQHGQDGAELDGDLERLQEFRFRHAEELGGEDEVPGRRDGQEFRQPFDGAQDDGVDPVHASFRLYFLKTGRNSRYGSMPFFTGAANRAASKPTTAPATTSVG